MDSLAPALRFDDGARVMITLEAPGYFRRGGTDNLVIPGAYPWAWLRVNVWDVHLGGTFEEAASRGLGGVGQSELFYAKGS